MRNIRVNHNRNLRGRNHQQQHAARINRVRVTGQFDTELERAILSDEREVVLEWDALYRANREALMRQYEQSRIEPTNFRNLAGTLILRALGRAGYSLRLSRAMLLA